LASASASRGNLLRGAGIAFDAIPSGIDEGEIKAAMLNAPGDGRETAERLAEAKAQAVSKREPSRIVIGADQLLQCDGEWFDRPPDRAAAAESLRALRGRTHELLTAVTAVRDGGVLWRHFDTARLTMRDFDDAFLETYLDRIGDEVTEVVGAYRLEGLGAQLFAKVEGDFFTILGLPLIPLLDFLRGEGIIAS
jgi:septum formation protein